MSSVELEQYFPMAEGDGAGADEWRWRRMGRLWSDNGVVRREEPWLQLNFHGWVENQPGLVVISGGAVWVDGFYGDTPFDRWLSTPGDDGMVCAFLMPTGNPLDGRARVELRFEPGYHIDAEWGQVEREDMWWLIPLWELNGFGNVTDRRRFIPPERQPPPLVEVPAEVPRPFFRSYVGPNFIDVHTSPVDVWVQGFGSDPDFVPGRNYRVTLYFNGPFFRTGNANWDGASICEPAIQDWKGVRATARIYGDWLQPGAYQLPTRSITFAVNDLDAGALFVVRAWTAHSFIMDTWVLGNSRVEVSDCGGGAVAAV
jgi:hypothetical protein